MKINLWVKSFEEYLDYHRRWIIFHQFMSCEFVHLFKVLKDSGDYKVARLVAHNEGWQRILGETVYTRFFSTSTVLLSNFKKPTIKDIAGTIIHEALHQTLWELKIKDDEKIVRRFERFSLHSFQNQELNNLILSSNTL